VTRRFGEQPRALHDRFDCRRKAERSEERGVKARFGPAEPAIIEARDMCRRATRAGRRWAAWPA